jgi:hypothetical protein
MLRHQSLVPTIRVISQILVEKDVAIQKSIGQIVDHDNRTHQRPDCRVPDGPDSVVINHNLIRPDLTENPGHIYRVLARLDAQPRAVIPSRGHTLNLDGCRKSIHFEASLPNDIDHVPGVKTLNEEIHEQTAQVSERSDRP